MTAVFELGYISRVPLGTAYPNIVAHVAGLLARLPQGTELVIDETGVGAPVAEMFQYAGVYPVGVRITAGDAVTGTGLSLHVPKLELISRVQALLHQGLLRIKRDLPEAEVLVRELQDFRVEYTAFGNLTFNARSGRHDDLVLALALACWRAAGGGVRFRGLLDYYAAQVAGSFARSRYYVGLDLGQSRDPTAIAVVKRVEGAAVSPGYIEATPVAGPGSMFEPAEVELPEPEPEPDDMIEVVTYTRGPGRSIVPLVRRVPRQRLK